MAEDSSLDSEKLRRQEYYRKFYTDLNDMRIEMGLPPKKYHLELLMDEVFTRTIFIKIHNEFYAVSCKELNQVFSRFGALDDVVQFNRGHGFHSKICFNSKESTMRAFEVLNGRNIYDDCCTMELFLVVDCVDEHTKKDIVAESPNQDQVTLNSPPRSSSMEESAALQISPSLDTNDRYSIECVRGQFDSCVEEEFDGASSKWWPSTNQTLSESQHEKQTSARAPSPLGVEFNLEANSETHDRWELCSLSEDQEIVELQDLTMWVSGSCVSCSMPRKLQISSPVTAFEFHNSTVNLDTLVVISEIASVELGDVLDDLEIGEIVADSIEIRGTNVKMYSIEFLEKIPAHKVFVKMLEKQMVGYIELLSTVEDAFRSIDSIGSFVFDPGKSNVLLGISIRRALPCFVKWVFDPGKSNIVVFDPDDSFASSMWAKCGFLLVLLKK